VNEGEWAGLGNEMAGGLNLMIFRAEGAKIREERREMPGVECSPA
jgi:hypothetical protein